MAGIYIGSSRQGQRLRRYWSTTAAGITASVNDPYYTSVASLLHFGGSDGSTTFTDQKSITWTPAGNAQIDTGLSKFGGSSLLLDGSGDYISASDVSLIIGTQDYTIEAWLYRNTSSTANIISWSGNNALYANAGSDTIILQHGGTNKATSGASTFAIGSFISVAISRIGTTTYLIVNGSDVHSFADSTNFAAGDFNIGRRSGSANMFNGSVDEFRVTIGVGRYSGAYTPATTAFPDS